MIKLGDVNVRAGSGRTEGNRLVIAQNVAGKPREVHPVGTYKVASATFSDVAATRMLPYSLAVGGTKKYAGLVVSALYRSRADSGLSINYRLTPHRVSGSHLIMEATVDQVTPLDTPSSFVLVSDYQTNKRVEIVFGNNGSVITSTLNGTTVYQKSASHVILNGDKLRVVRLKSIVELYINDVLVNSGQHSSITPVLPNECFAGIATSCNNNVLSTGFKGLSIECSTDYANEMFGRLDAETTTLGSNGWYGLGAIFIDAAGPALVSLNNFSWETQTTGYNRQFRLLVNGAVQQEPTITAQNGGSKSITGTLTAGVKLEIQGYSNAGSGDPLGRTVKTGTLEVTKPAA